ncbi:MAG TPA: hypothetical protein VJN42_12135 [Candidatus Acidoferrum sp.]|nr:hypothetical protein [Candidatus Acidoferrum sp.]
MTRSLTKYTAWIALAAGFTVPSAAAQSSSAAASSQSAGSGASAGPQQGTATTQPDSKKPKKVWTNDDLGALNQLPSAKKDKDAPNSSSSSSSGNAPDPQYVANTKKQLEKLEGQLRDIEQQLRDLKDFQAGKAPATSGGYEFNKGYNRVPVDQQITNLEGKKRQTQAKIDDLLDEARKKGVEPGQLR